MTIPRPILMEKKEREPEDLNKYMVRDHPLAHDGINLVSCPWRQYNPTSTVECSICPFLHGFGPYDIGKPMSRENFRVFCAYPIARQVIHIKS